MITNQELLKRLLEEYSSRCRNSIYGYTSRSLAYNSNKIEGSTLTEDQTATLFDYGQLYASDDVYRAKDIEEMQGHFLMFNTMLQTINQQLSEELIKKFHHELKSGVFEDRANGYAIGEYKKRPNMIGRFETVLPQEVSNQMKNLIEWYQENPKNLNTLALFHAKYECIHPFQDGNGRTGRIILFREALVNDIQPFIIEDSNRATYIDALIQFKTENKIDKLTALFEIEQQVYIKKVNYFIE